MYTVKEVAELLHVNPHTIRYYTNQNLTPRLHRNENGVRLFDEIDLQYLQITIYLRRCGMSIQDIRKYFVLAEEGDDTVQERYQMLLQQQEKLNQQLQQLSQSQDYISHKLELYAAQIRQVQQCEEERAE